MHCSPPLNCVVVAALATVWLAADASAQHGPGTDSYQPTVHTTADAADQITAVFAPADGLAVEMVATEPQLANPVSFDIAPDGRILVVETHRLRAGVIDMRDHQGWVQEDLASRTVADRIAEIEQHFAGRLDDWRADHERIRCLFDSDGDGHYERSTVFADGFNALEDGIAAGVLVDGQRVWFTDIPSLWLLHDDDRDGIADRRDRLHTGYGVHFSLIGHDMHGLRIGPDRRLYFSIGDRGFHVEHDGEVFAYPHEGAVLRCELDGSHLEVVHRGLRNPQELAFDDHGNLFTGDNNSDGGDRARWVYVVEGGDSGWRIGFQWLPTRGAWNAEQLWKPWTPAVHPQRAAYVVPPIANVADGPSGLTWNPGTGLPARWRDHFLLCDFRGAAASSGVWALQNAAVGAGFMLAATEQLVWKVLATDVEFGFDGGVYLLDWVHGWEKTGRGRIHRLFAPDLEDDPLIAETAMLLRDPLAKRELMELVGMIKHPDRRVRQAAQFELVDRRALDELQRVATSSTHPLARLHAIWGIGIASRRSPGEIERIRPLLRDPDLEVRTQVARLLGEVRPAGVGDELLGALADPAARVRYQAAIALGKLGEKRAVEPIVEILRDEAEVDPYLRHAAIVALTGIDDVDKLHAAACDPDRDVRQAIAVVLRRWRDPWVAELLRDPDPAVATEAARAIHDLPIRAALPALAALSEVPGIDHEPLVRRALGAHRLLGRAKNIAALLAYASRADAPATMRIEALEILAEWKHPDPQDRVHGNIVELGPRSRILVDGMVVAALPRLLAAGQDQVDLATCRMVERLQSPGAADALRPVVFEPNRTPETRVAALQAIAATAEPDVQRAVAAAVSTDDPVTLRRQAVQVLATLDPAAGIPILTALVRDGELEDRRQALTTLGGIPDHAASEALAEVIERIDELPVEVQLDALVAATGQRGPAEAARARWLASGNRMVAGPLVMSGGDADRGEGLFREHAAAMCQRCHSLGGQGGQAGPALDGIGQRRDRPYLLRALLEPGADIAEGYANLMLTLDDGSTIGGTLRSEDQTTIVLVDSKAETIEIEKARVSNRQSFGSAMPPMEPILAPKEIRDLIEFLATR